MTHWGKTQIYRLFGSDVRLRATGHMLSNIPRQASPMNAGGQFKLFNSFFFFLLLLLFYAEPAELVRLSRRKKKSLKPSRRKCHGLPPLLAALGRRRFTRQQTCMNIIADLRQPSGLEEAFLKSQSEPLKLITSSGRASDSSCASQPSWCTAKCLG